MARITKESLLQLSKEMEVLTAEETKSFLGGTNSTVQPLGNKKDKEPIYVEAPPLPEVVVTPGGSSQGNGSQSYDNYMYNLGYNRGYSAGISEEIMDDFLAVASVLFSPSSGPVPGVTYDATAYPNMGSYSSGVIKGLTDGYKDAKKK